MRGFGIFSRKCLTLSKSFVWGLFGKIKNETFLYTGCVAWWLYMTSCLHRSSVRAKSQLYFLAECMVKTVTVEKFCCTQSVNYKWALLLRYS